MAAKTETIARAKARHRQELRRSNAAVPIPAARHKRSRSWTKQQLRKKWR
jgi:hypothetical protein